MSIYTDDDPFLIDLKNWLISNPISKEELDSWKEQSTIKVPGVPHSQEFKDSVRMRMIGNKNTLGLKCNPLHVAARAKSRSRQVEIDGIVYTSGKEAAEKLGLSRPAITMRIRRGKAKKITNA